MRHLSPVHRVIASVVLIIGTAVSAVLPIADSYAERAAVGIAHVESAGSDGCLPVHDELACDLCRVLRLALTQCAPADAFVASRAFLAATGAVAARSPLARLGRNSSPRAPPQG